MFYYQGGTGLGPMFSMGLKEFIKNSFKSGSIITKLIYINIAVYLATKVGILVAFLLGEPKSEYFHFLNSILDCPGNVESWLHAPWTMLTYMFLHYGVLHLFFNMVLLFWSGRALKERFSDAILMGIYLLGGIVGALMYLFVAPKLGTTTHMAGASASVMALLTARIIWQWNEPVHIMLLGAVKSLYVLLFILAFELLQLSNPIGVGSSIAHLGGAAVGLLIGLYLLFTAPKSRDSADNGEIHWEGDLNRTRESEEKRENQNRVNDILDKVSEQGYDSLTPEEKSILFKSGQR